MTSTPQPAGRPTKNKLSKKFYEKELNRLQVELVKLQSYVKGEGLRVVVIFEGRDAAGKGGVIKRITERLNPRVCRVEALGTPTEREKTQWWFQRYVNYLPAAGELVLFDRSWYNRALVVLFGEVVLEDAGGCCPSERSVFSVVIVEVDEPVVGVGALGV